MCLHWYHNFTRRFFLEEQYLINIGVLDTEHRHLTATMATADTAKLCSRCRHLKAGEEQTLHSLNVPAPQLSISKKVENEALQGKPREQLTGQW